MRAIGRVVGAAAAASLLLTGCGADTADTAPDSDGVDAGATAVDGDDGTGASVQGDDGAGGGTSDVVITVDGQAYPIPNFMGGQCNTESEPERARDMAVYGFAESGERIELWFDRVSAESSSSGQEEYWGHLGRIGGGAEGPWTTTSLEPWPWLAEDRSHVTDTVTMEDSDGGTIEVAFDVTCP